MGLFIKIAHTNASSIFFKYKSLGEKDVLLPTLGGNFLHVFLIKNLLKSPINLIPYCYLYLLYLHTFSCAEVSGLWQALGRNRHSNISLCIYHLFSNLDIHISVIYFIKIQWGGGSVGGYRELEGPSLTEKQFLCKRSQRR